MTKKLFKTSFNITIYYFLILAHHAIHSALRAVQIKTASSAVSQCHGRRTDQV